jgi:hypothetical protein
MDPVPLRWIRTPFFIIYRPRFRRASGALPARPCSHGLPSAANCGQLGHLRRFNRLRANGISSEANVARGAAALSVVRYRGRARQTPSTREKSRGNADEKCLMTGNFAGPAWSRGPMQSDAID